MLPMPEWGSGTIKFGYRKEIQLQIGLNENRVKQDRLDIPRVVVAGATSNVGKTSITCAVIHGLRNRCYSVQPFKVGPDYIDPSLLSAVAGSAAGNLDPWLMGGSSLRNSFVTYSKSDISVIEGVMGYYDGLAGSSNYASTFDVARRLACPVILVLDAGGTARSIAAMATGFVKFHRSSRIAGVILNRLGSEKHERMCREALEPLKIPVLGAVPRRDSLRTESRHLGLVPAAEGGSAERIRKVAEEISEYLNIDRIAEICRGAAPLKDFSPAADSRRRAVLGVALDSSFNFYYRENLDILRQCGAEIRFFSPVADAELPECDGIYIGGGFPEVRAADLAGNLSMVSSVRRAAESGMPIYAECGGLMYLTRSIIYGEKRHDMVGLFDADTAMTGRMVLNYTEARTLQSNILARAGRTLRAHEFHYSKLESVPPDARFSYRLSTGEGISDGMDGFLQYGTLASYCHIMLQGGRARNLVDSCSRFSRG